MRLVLDTNVLVSGLAYPGSLPGRLVGAWRSGAVELATSQFILGELARVLPAMRPPRLTETEASQLVELVEFNAQVVVPAP
ncbi:MAG: PIN domain-containing protein, partial [Bifidobacteriaceae bacterium]|nr:PIN domain-containing protein [Bifidobacteriaceae bacterium]